jgi:hypothetical protein
MDARSGRGRKVSASRRAFRPSPIREYPAPPETRCDRGAGVFPGIGAYPLPIPNPGGVEDTYLSTNAGTPATSQRSVNIRPESGACASASFECDSRALTT